MILIHCVKYKIKAFLVVHFITLNWQLCQRQRSSSLLVYVTLPPRGLMQGHTIKHSYFCITLNDQALNCQLWNMYEFCLNLHKWRALFLKAIKNSTTRYWRYEYKWVWVNTMKKTNEKTMKITSNHKETE